MICVYTYDVADEEDCRTRVKESLTPGLGVTWKIPVQDGCGHLCRQVLDARRDSRQQAVRMGRLATPIPDARWLTSLHEPTEKERAHSCQDRLAESSKLHGRGRLTTASR